MIGPGVGKRCFRAERCLQKMENGVFTALRFSKKYWKVLTERFLPSVRCRVSPVRSYVSVDCTRSNQ